MKSLKFIFLFISIFTINNLKSAEICLPSIKYSKVCVYLKSEINKDICDSCCKNYTLIIEMKPFKIGDKHYMDIKFFMPQTKETIIAFLNANSINWSTIIDESDDGVGVDSERCITIIAIDSENVKSERKE